MIIDIIFGLIIGYLLCKLIHPPIKYRGCNPNIIKKKIKKTKNKCYKFVPTLI